MTRYHVIVIGGGPAGLSAALLLGRARRRVLVIDEGQPRNRAGPSAHGVFTRDGTPPAELLALGRSQLASYPSVTLRSARATAVHRDARGFVVRSSDGTFDGASRILLATGLRDDLPPVPGLDAIWGIGAFHCPYCDAWEVRDSRLAAYARGAAAMELVPLLLGWSRDVVLCTDGPAELAEADREELHRHGVPVLESPIARLVGSSRLEQIVFRDGSALARDAIVVRTVQRQASPLAEELGCRLSGHGLIEVGPNAETTVPGVYAAGDAASQVQQVSVAAGLGVQAAIAINHQLALDDFVAGPAAVSE